MLELFPQQVSIPGIELYIHKDSTLLVSSGTPLMVLSSAILGGGFTRARYIINHTVDKSYNSDTPENDLMQAAYNLQLEDEVVGMMTAVSAGKTFLSQGSSRGISVAALCTAGVSNPGVAGLPVSEVAAGYRPGTVNIILLIDGDLTGGALVNAVKTATEAKTRAFGQAGVILPGGEQVTGTTTDSIAVACTGQGEQLRYAGTGTGLGYLIGSTVYESVLQGIKDYLASVQKGK